jgi:hypothetical protein
MRLIRFLLPMSLVLLPTFAQTVTLRGQVTDESGAVVPDAKLTVTGPAGIAKTSPRYKDAASAALLSNNQEDHNRD